MVDIFALVLSHGLLALAAWRLLLRPDLDVEGARAEKSEKARDEARPNEERQRPIRRGVTWNRGAGDDA